VEVRGEKMTMMNVYRKLKSLEEEVVEGSQNYLVEEVGEESLTWDPR
jgi:hypothetical protein